MKKPPARITSIAGKFQEDVITDDELLTLSELQAEAWQTEKRVQRAVAAIEARIQQGARITAKRYYFDREEGMVHRRSSLWEEPGFTDMIEAYRRT